MKLFLMFAAAALIVGGIYHTEVSAYFADLADGSFSGGGSSVVDSMGDMGRANNNLMNGIGNTLGR
jgi:hypothetical protein